jgi:hypothetical protein
VWLLVVVLAVLAVLVVVMVLQGWWEWPCGLLRQLLLLVLA